MFNYGNANEAQKEAISATDGLVLITAGPGTGKTFTLVKRAVYLIQECGIKPCCRTSLRSEKRYRCMRYQQNRKEY